MVCATCFKLTYLLGTSCGKIVKAYPVETRVAKQNNFMFGDQHVREVRHLSLIVGYLFENYMQLTVNEPLPMSVKDELSKREWEEYSDELCALIDGKRGQSLSEYINSLLSERDALVEYIYRVGHFTIPFELFIKFFSLNSVTPTRCLQYSLIASELQPEMDIVFGVELFDIGQKAMFKADNALYGRIAMLNGKPHGITEDNSKFQLDVEDYRKRVHVSPTDLTDWDELYVLSNSDGSTSSRIAAYWGESSSNGLSIKKIGQLELGTLPTDSKCFVILDQQDLVHRLSRLFPRISFGILLPVLDKNFTRWSQRVIPNIYFVRPYSAPAL